MASGYMTLPTPSKASLHVPKNISTELVEQVSRLNSVRGENLTSLVLPICLFVCKCLQLVTGRLSFCLFVDPTKHGIELRQVADRSRHCDWLSEGTCSERV